MKSLLSSRGKKGQINSLVPSIIALVIAAVFLVLGLVITQSIRDVDTLKTSSSVLNEGGGWINETGYTLEAENGFKTDTFAITSATNTTSGKTIAAANYTVDKDTGIVTNTSIARWPNVRFNYTFASGSEAWDAGNDTVSGLGTFADFWDIIVLAIITTLVIGLLLNAFGRRAGR